MRMFAVISWMLLYQAALASSEAERSYSVDDMLSSEDIGEVRFSPNGDRLLIDYLVPYEQSRLFNPVLIGQLRARTWHYELSSKEGARALLSDDESVWIESYSPQGTRVALGWLDGEAGKLAVYDFGRRKLRKFDFNAARELLPYPFEFEMPLWLSENKFVVLALGAEDQRRFSHYYSYAHERMHERSRQAWEGREPTVSIHASGRQRQRQPDRHFVDASLLRVDAITGKIETIANGPLRDLSVSPDRRRIAVLRDIGRFELAGLPMEAMWGADRALQLEVYDLAAGTRKTLPCEGCNTALDSLRWSPSGHKLYFATRVRGEQRERRDQYIYDFQKRRLIEFRPKNLPFAPVHRQWALDTPFVWLTDDTPAVRVSRASPAKASEKASEMEAFEWFAVPPRGAPISLTGKLQPKHGNDAFRHYVAVRGGAMLMMVDGDLWKLAADGTRKNLTADIVEELRPWCSAKARQGHGRSQTCAQPGQLLSVRSPDETALRKGWLAFQQIENGIGSGHLVFVNIDSGQRERVVRPSADARLTTVSALTQSAVYLEVDEHGDRLLLARSGANPHELMRFNAHLAKVASPKPIRLERREPGEREDRYDWLLLPPDWRPGDRLPLLVYFYPDTAHGGDWNGGEAFHSDPRSVDWLNMNVPAGRGYAVLLASMKIASWKERGHPLQEMHEQLIRAAENVVKLGYADPDRWALMGQSYGGYGTLGVVSWTSRFRAAVAATGPVNLTSSYSAGMSPITAFYSEIGARTFGMMWSEDGQGRMGVPPWQDPQRYIDNSPLFRVDKIQTPVMLVYGQDDNDLPYQGQEMFNALNRLDKEAVLLRYWGELHGFQSPANIRDLWGRILEWLDQHLDVARSEDGRVQMREGRMISSGH